MTLQCGIMSIIHVYNSERLMVRTGRCRRRQNEVLQDGAMRGSVAIQTNAQKGVPQERLDFGLPLLRLALLPPISPMRMSIH